MLSEAQIDGRRRHKCDQCGRVAPWDDDWWWFGSYRDEEDGIILKMCSEKCHRLIGNAELALRIKRGEGDRLTPANKPKEASDG